MPFGTVFKNIIENGAFAPSFSIIFSKVFIVMDGMGPSITTSILNARIAQSVACIALTSWIPHLCHAGSNLASVASKKYRLVKNYHGMHLNGLTVTFRVAVVSQCIFRPNDENCTGFPHH